jgi:hypothetical protein
MEYLNVIYFLADQEKWIQVYPLHSKLANKPSRFFHVHVLRMLPLLTRTYHD